MGKRSSLPRPVCLGSGREICIGQAVDILRMKKGSARRRQGGRVDAYDEASGVVMVRHGEKVRKVPVYMCIVSSTRQDLPVDVLIKLGLFLSAKRSMRVACVSKQWRFALGSHEPDTNWRLRLFRRWPPPSNSFPIKNNCYELYRDRSLAQHAVQKEARSDQRTRTFCIRLCAWPNCLHRLESRRAALAHHIDHPGCWGPRFSFDDLLFLRAQNMRLRHEYLDQLKTYSDTYPEKQTTSSSFSLMQEDNTILSPAQSTTAALLAEAKKKYRSSSTLCRAAARGLLSS